MIERVNVIGSGRVGSAVSARLRERGVAVGEDDPDVVLLCVPDTAISDVSRYLIPGRAWIGHVSGATPRKWPGRAAPSAPVSPGSTQVAKPAG